MIVEDFLEQARAVILPGFTEFDVAVEQLIELVADDEEPCDGLGENADQVSTEAVPALVRRLWDAREAEQQDWPEVTDTDRMTMAFAVLETDGIVARMNFTCCQTCGFAEIGQEAASDTAARGFVFFHAQDAERLAAEPATLLLSYGAFGASNQAAYETAVLEIGHRVVAAIETAGLTPRWNGSLSDRIGVADLRWRRRLPR